MQTDLFSNGGSEDSARSLPPYLDPARVSIVLVDREEDRDHVAAPVAGVLPVGALGNNAEHFVPPLNQHAALLAENKRLREALENQIDRMMKLSDSDRSEFEVRAFLVAAFALARAALSAPQP